jgi:hypothetical protein
MADVRKDDKQLKKDQSIARDVRAEVEDQMRDGADSQPIIRNPNRDQARGDVDRSGAHRGEDVEGE